MRCNRIWQSAVKKTWGSGGDGTMIETSEQVLKSQEAIQGATVNTFSGNTEIRDKKISGVDFTGAQLRSLRLFRVTLVDCRFDQADLRDLRMWASDIRGCTFRKCDLRGAGLGGILDGKRNSFTDADFSEADMRQTGWTSAALDRCFFKDTSLVGVNLQGSTFCHCTFEGELRDVIFNRYAFKREDLPANIMDRVDFSNARLRFVGFRKLKLDHVSFPQDSEHLVFTDYRRVLEHMINCLREADDLVSKKLLFFLSNEIKWVEADQAQGVLNIADLKEVAGESAPQKLLATL